MLGQEDLELKDSLGFVETIKQEGKNVLAGVSFIILHTLILKHIAEAWPSQWFQGEHTTLGTKSKGFLPQSRLAFELPCPHRKAVPLK